VGGGRALDRAVTGPAYTAEQHPARTACAPAATACSEGDHQACPGPAVVQTLADDRECRRHGLRLYNGAHSRLAATVDYLVRATTHRRG